MSKEKGAFVGQLVLRALPQSENPRGAEGKQLWRLAEGFPYFSQRFGLIIVPERFVSDFASVPAAVPRWIIDDDSPEILFGAIVHDYLYAVGGRLPDGRVLTRQEADEILAECMEVLGASAWRRMIVYHAVRLGGSDYWGGRLPAAA